MTLLRPHPVPGITFYSGEVSMKKFAMLLVVGLTMFAVGCGAPAKKVEKKVEKKEEAKH